MSDDYLANLMDDADRIVATDLYPVRCRTVIANLAAALRTMTTDLQEAREYGLAMQEELAARAAKTDSFVAMAASMHDDFQAAAAAPLGKPPVEVRFTWAEGDQEVWLHMKLPDGKQAGINLGNPKTMIATAALRALVSKDAPL